MFSITLRYRTCTLTSRRAVAANMHFLRAFSTTKTDTERKKSRYAPSERLYVGNLPFEATEQQVRDLLEEYGPIDDLQIMRDAEGSSRGFGFALFENARDAFAAFSAVVKIGNRLMRTDFSAPGQLYPSAPTQSHVLFVGNLPIDTTEAQLREQFAPFGSIRKVRLALDENGGFRRFAHVEYKHEDDAIVAYECLVDEPPYLLDRRLRIDFATPYKPPEVQLASSSALSRLSGVNRGFVPRRGDRNQGKRRFDG
ncbi:hypothetical protein C8F01DRAFT_19482 [Mycena amicta]|nr:hypothetical protein C8F01DRAFT_19482 [Mycena amicta]